MVGFLSFLRISEIENLRENDSAPQAKDEGNALKVRIRKSDTDPEGQGALRSLLPTGNVLRPSSACIEWMRIRGWASDADSPFIF